MHCESCAYSRAASPLRILYAFDPQQQAVLLLGADKTGMANVRFYSVFVPQTEKRWEKYLRAI